MSAARGAHALRPRPRVAGRRGSRRPGATVRKAGGGGGRDASRPLGRAPRRPSSDEPTGRWQLGEDGYSRILQEREVLGDDARALRARGQAEFDRLDAEMTRARPGRRRQPRLRRGPPRGRRSATRRPSRRCSRPTPSGPRRARAFLARDRPGDAAAGRVLRGRPVAGVPAADPGRRVVHRAAGVLGPLEGPLLRPVRARRHLGGGDPGAAVEQLVRVDPHDRRSTRPTRATTGTS